jgi:flagellar biosynthesis protein FlhG
VKSLEEQDHYEVLEVARSAERPEIERAYRMLQATYATDSLALYSVFDESDTADLKERIENAFQVLADADTRRAYDDELAGLAEDAVVVPHGEAGGFPAGALFEAADSSSLGLHAEEAAAAAVSEVDGGELVPGIEGFQDLEGDADEGADFDGPRLRRARLQRGIELDQIANVTKVSPAFLRGIEEEAYDELPAPVYVRGFLVAYARAIGLDSTHVAASYMARFEESKQGSRRTRLLGRR